MKILITHNTYSKFSGEEAVVQAQSQLLKNKGHEVIRYERNSDEISRMLLGQVRAFISGIYSLTSRRKMRQLLEEHKPDLVHVHNLYPLISPSVLPECRESRVPVVMTVHNYRLICPNGLFMVHGNVCEKCRGGSEYNCFLKNCEGSLFKSLGYGLRNYVARVCRFYKDNVSVFACLTEFQKQKLTEEGFEENKIVILPNLVEDKKCASALVIGDYVAFVGRVSPEKGVDILLHAIRKAGNIPLRIAGAYDRMPYLVDQADENIEFAGYLQQSQLTTFYENCRIIVLPSICY